MIAAGRHDAIEAGAAPGGAGGIEAEGAVGMRDGAEINVGAAVAGKRDFDARVGLTGELDGGVEARVNDVAGRFQAAKPASVGQAFRGMCIARFGELDDFAGHAFGDFERRNGKVELVHAAADELDEQPEKKTADEGDFGPDFEIVAGGVLVEMTNGGMNGGGIETGAAKGVEVGD